MPKKKKGKDSLAGQTLYPIATLSQRSDWVKGLARETSERKKGNKRKTKIRMMDPQTI